MRRVFFARLFAAIIVLSAGPAASMEMELEVFRVYYRKAADLVEPLKAVASRHGRLAAEEKSNTLIVRDYPSNMAAIKRLLKKLDARPQNVRITVGFVERRELRKLDMEVRWIFSDDNWSVGSVRSISGRKTGLSVTPLTAAEMFDSINRQELFLLENSGGEIFVGLRIPRPDYFMEYAARHGYIKESVNYKNASASFGVTARVLGDGRIELEIAPKLTTRSGENIILAAASVLIIMDQNRPVIMAGNKEKSDNFGSRFLTSINPGREAAELVMTLKAVIE